MSAQLFTHLPPPSPSSTINPLPSPSSTSSPPSSSSSTTTRRSVGQYIVTKRLGHGSFATVWRGHHRTTNAPVAIKSISRSKLSGHVKHADNLQSEISILRTLQSPHIVQLLDLQSSERHIYLILEFCAGGDLSHFLRQHKALPLPLVQHFARHLMLGLQLLHSKQLIHRDLKPQNLLLDQATHPMQATLKLADFGFARELEGEDLAATLCGSPLYMAPEILRYQPYDGKADLWSVGAIVYEMVAGRPPYTGQNHLELLQRIDREEVHFPATLQVSAECVDFIVRLLKRRPEERMSFEHFFDHPFVRARPQRNNRPEPEDLVSGRGGDGPVEEDSSSALRSSSTQQRSVRDVASAADRATRSSQTIAPPQSRTGRAGDVSTVAATLASHRSGRVSVEVAGSAGEEAVESVDRAGIVLASSPPLDIPSSTSSYPRNARASPVLVPASTSPPLLTGSSPPSPSPLLAVSSAGRRLSSSRSGSFDERPPGQRRDSSSSRSSGSGTAELATSERGRTSGSIERDDYEMVERTALESPSQEPQRSAQAVSPSLRAFGGKLQSFVSTLTSSLYTQPAPSPVTDSPTLPPLPPISEVEACSSVRDPDDEGDSHGIHRSHSRHRTAARQGTAVVDPMRSISAAFRQSVQSVLLDVHLASTLARCADFYRDQAEEQMTQEELLPLTQQLQSVAPKGGTVSLQACALGLYVKALTRLHLCIDFMDSEYARIMQEHRYDTMGKRDARHEEGQSALLATSAVYKTWSWQDGLSLITTADCTLHPPPSQRSGSTQAHTPRLFVVSVALCVLSVYSRLVRLVSDYTAAAEKCSTPFRLPASSPDKAKPQHSPALFDIGVRSPPQRDPSTVATPPSQQPLDVPTDISPAQPASSASLLLSSASAPGDASSFPSSSALPPATLSSVSSSVLTFTSSSPPVTSASILLPSPASVLDPLLLCYLAVREWLLQGVLHEGGGEWAEADLYYRQARTLCNVMREEASGLGDGSVLADVELFDSMAEVVECRVQGVATAVEGLRKSDERTAAAADAVWKGEDEAVYGTANTPVIEAEV